MRTSLVLAALALSLGSLTACGSDENSADSSYCKDLKADKAYFDSLGGGTPDVSKLDEAFKRMHSLADEAPDAVKDDWKVLDGALTTITDALKSAGIKMSDLAKLQQGQIPKGADPQKLATLGPKLQELGSGKVETASKNIQKHAKSTCKVTIGSN